MWENSKIQSLKEYQRWDHEKDYVLCRFHRETLRVLNMKDTWLDLCSRVTLVVEEKIL